MSHLLHASSAVRRLVYRAAVAIERWLDDRSTLPQQTWRDDTVAAGPDPSVSRLDQMDGVGR